MIQICHIITGLYTGGAEMMLYKLLSRVNRERFECSVISLIDKGTLGERIESLGIPVYTLNMRAGRPSVAGLIRLRRLLRELRPNLLQGWMYHGNIAASLAARLMPDKPAVLWNIRQGLDDLAYEKRLTRGMIRLSAWLSGSVRAIIYNSGAGIGQHEKIGFCADRRVIVPNGFDCSSFAPSTKDRLAWRARHGFGHGELLIGLAARYHPMKDHDNFLKTAAILAARYEGVRFVLTGSGVDENNELLVSRILDLELSGRVRLLGESRNVGAFFQSLDIAALASAWGEGFPNVLGEAMACGVPCVATDVGDSAEIIGDTGRIVPPRDAEALAAACGELIELGSERRVRLGGRARDRILARYALPVVVARYEALYDEAAGG